MPGPQEPQRPRAHHLDTNGAATWRDMSGGGHACVLAGNLSETRALVTSLCQMVQWALQEVSESIYSECWRPVDKFAGMQGGVEALGERGGTQIVRLANFALCLKSCPGAAHSAEHTRKNI